MIELDELLAETANEPPCGPDLEYDPEFRELEQAARGKPEQQLGETVVPGEVPDWTDVSRRAQVLLARTKDVRAAVLLARALVCTESAMGLSAGLNLIYGLLDRYWDAVHPRLEAEDNNDPTMRMNALQPLADPDTFLRDLRGIEVVRADLHGRVSVRDILVAAGKLPPGSMDALTQPQIEGILRAAASEDTSALDALQESGRLALKLKTLLVEKVGAEYAPDLAPLIDLLKMVNLVCDRGRGQASGQIEEATLRVDDAGRSPAASGDLRSRDDALQLLDRVCQFMERTEPSNPAPLLIRRAQRLMSKDFIEIIRDLAPDSLSTIQNIAGLDRE